MLNHIRLWNFKSWEKLDLPLGKITGLFGTNSSGKTSILQFLLLLKQTKETSDRNVSLELNGSLVQLGIPSDLIFDHNISKRVQMMLDFDTDAPLALRDATKTSTQPFISGKRLRFAARHFIRNNEFVSDFLGYKIEDAIFKISRDENQGKFRLESSLSEDQFRFVRGPGRAWQLPGPNKTYQFPDQARAYYQNASFLADFELQLENCLDNVYYLGPLRDYPQRDYLWARSRPTDVGKKGEKSIDAILAATSQGETRNLKWKGRHKPFEEMIAYWLKKLGLIYSFRVVEIAAGSNRWQVKVRTTRGSAEVLLTDVGFGVSQILPVITLLYYVPEGASVILEQPEIHLHPLAQAELADLFIAVAKHRRVQIILESHSEHLLLRLQRRIAEEEISNEDVKLYFCNTAARKSNLTDLDLDIFGNIKNWPRDFMGRSFEETAEAEIARIRRLQAK